jgi:hypothetical protein
MKVLINEKELTKDITELDKQKLIQEVHEHLDDSIIVKIYLDEVEVNLDYFLTNDIEIKEFNCVKFISKKTDTLVKETLEEAHNYLPKLKNGLINISNLMKNGKKELAGNKFLLALEGFEWYTGVLDNVSSLIDNEELKQLIQDKLDQFNVLISKALVLH